jgi:tetratricopeptide (TPR) repeat protein
VGGLDRIADAPTVGALGMGPQELIDAMRARHRQSPGGGVGEEAVALGLGSGSPELIALGWRWVAQDTAVDVPRRLSAARAAARLSEDPLQRLEALLTAGELEMTDGDPQEAEALLSTVYREADWNRHLTPVVSASIGLSNLYLKAGRRREAAELFVQILAQTDPQTLPDTRSRVSYAYALVELAGMHRTAGRADLHRQLTARAAGLLRELGEETLARWAETR